LRELAALLGLFAAIFHALKANIILAVRRSFSLSFFSSKIAYICNQGGLSSAYPKHKVDAVAVDTGNLVKDLDEDVFLRFENCEANAGKG